MTVDPPSYAVDLGQSIRETEAPRLLPRSVEDQEAPQGPPCSPLAAGPLAKGGLSRAQAARSGAAAAGCGTAVALPGFDIAASSGAFPTAPSECLSQNGVSILMPAST